MQAMDETATDDSHATALEEPESYETPSSEHIDLEHRPEDLDLSNLTLSPSQSTPRASAQAKPEPTANFAEYPSPYEALRREVVSTEGAPSQQDEEAATPITPGKTTAFNDISMTPESSPYNPPNTTGRPSTTRKKTDPLLHRILDKNYRVAATPLTSHRGQPTATQQQRRGYETTTPATTTRFAPNPDFSSSPAMPDVPQINSEIFSSPIRGLPPSARKPRTPGVSVLTPGKGKNRNTPKPQRSSRAAPAAAAAPTAASAGIWDSDDEDEEGESALYGGVSPPKTFSFHVPQSRLLKTPAQEASKRIVHDLLQTAGATGGKAAAGGRAGQDDYGLDPEFDFTDEIDLGYDPNAEGAYGDEFEQEGEEGVDEADSPSVVKGRGGNLAEMTF